MSDFRVRKAAHLLREAKAARFDKAYDHAVRLLLRAAELAPLDSSIRVELAKTYQASGNLIEAAREARRAQEDGPDDPQRTYLLAYLLVEVGQFQEAEHLLLELKQVYPNNPNLLGELGLIWRNTRQLKLLLHKILPLAAATDDAKLLGLCAQGLEISGQEQAAHRLWKRVRTLAPELAPKTRPHSLRDALLAQHGALVLGTAHDNAVVVPTYSTYLVSNDDIVETLVRLVTCARHFAWEWPSVSPLDDDAHVLAILIGRALDIPVVASSDSEVSLVVASLLTADWPDRFAWAQASADEGRLFAFGMVHPQSFKAGHPTILGIPCQDRVCLPWHRLGEARVGFSQQGLLADLPSERDTRPAEQIADDYWPTLRERLATHPSSPSCAALVSLYRGRQAQFHPKLRKPHALAHLPPRPDDREVHADSYISVLTCGDRPAIDRVLAGIEARLSSGPPPTDVALVDALEHRFVRSPFLRMRISDILFRIVPGRFGAFLEQLVEAGPEPVPERERERLIHLYGCHPWSPTPRQVLPKWLALEGPNAEFPTHLRAALQSEVVQSKYGLLFLAEDPSFPRILDALLCQPLVVALGVLQWLHDEPSGHRYIGQTAHLLDHDNSDVVFATLRLHKVAGTPVPYAYLEDKLSESTTPAPIAEVATHLLVDHPLDNSREKLAAQALDTSCVELAAAAIHTLIVHPDPAGAEQLGQVFATFVAGQTIPPECMHALRGAPDYDRLAPVLGSLTHVGHVKALVSTCQQMLVDFDDPRLVEHIRAYPDCHVLDPVYGFASYLYRHGSPSSDLAHVHNCLGATNLDAGYQAMAVLADWGVAGQAQQLLDALDYTSAHAWAALRALLLHPFLSPVISIEALLDRIAARGLSGPDRAALWPILEQLANNEPLASQFTTWANNSGQLPQWERFFEATLRLEVPRPYRLGAQSASFRIFATLLPDVFTRFSARILADSPDRFALDLLEYLGRHHPELAATYASHHLTSGHWGMRTCARKIATRLK